MSDRGDDDLVADIEEAISRIRRYAAGMSFEAFLNDTRTQDAVVRNLEIIGEAAKKLSAKFRKSHGGTKWRDIGGMRDRLIHNYAGVNWEIVWDVIQVKLPELEKQLREPPDRDDA